VSKLWKMQDLRCHTRILLTNGNDRSCYPTNIIFMRTGMILFFCIIKRSFLQRILLKIFLARGTRR
jgi:hypothetical protein